MDKVWPASSVIGCVSSVQSSEKNIFIFPSAFSPLYAFPVAVIVVDRLLLFSSVLIGILEFSKSISSIFLSPDNTVSILTGFDSTNIFTFTNVAK